MGGEGNPGTYHVNGSGRDTYISRDPRVTSPFEPRSRAPKGVTHLGVAGIRGDLGAHAQTTGPQPSGFDTQAMHDQSSHAPMSTAMCFLHVISHVRVPSAIPLRTLPSSAPFP